MAIAHDDENLLFEAKSIVERVELALIGQSNHVTAGFRANGAFSVFFGADPVYQFNSLQLLRRVFADGLLYKAESGRLVCLRRERLATETALVRRDLSNTETAAFLVTVGMRLAALRMSLAAGNFQIVGQVPAEKDVVGRLSEWLRQLELPLRAADFAARLLAVQHKVRVLTQAVEVANLSW